MWITSPKRLREAIYEGTIIRRDYIYGCPNRRLSPCTWGEKREKKAGLSTGYSQGKYLGFVIGSLPDMGM